MAERRSRRPDEDFIEGLGRPKQLWLGWSSGQWSTAPVTDPSQYGTHTIQYAQAALGVLPCSAVTGSYNNATRTGMFALNRESAKRRQPLTDMIVELANVGYQKCPGGFGGSGKGGGGSRGGGGGGGGGGAPAGPTVTRQIRVTDRETARSYLRSYLKDELGRMPTEPEVDIFVGNLNGQEKVRPTVTTTTTKGSTQTQSTVEGLSPSAYAEEYAEKKVAPTERKEYQGVKYMDILSQMIAGGG